MHENDVHTKGGTEDWRDYLKDEEKHVVTVHDARVLRRKLIKRDEVNHEFNLIRSRCIKRRQRARGQG